MQLMSFISIWATIALIAPCHDAFAPIQVVMRSRHMETTSMGRVATAIYSSTGGDSNNEDDDKMADPEGANMAAELFRMAQQKGVQIDDADLDEDDEDEDEEDDDDDDDDAQKSEFDSPKPNLTDDKLYSEVKERVLDTAGGFVQYVTGAQAEDTDDDEDSDDDDSLSMTESGPGGTDYAMERISATSSDYEKPYVPPENVPDPELTAGEVVLLVLKALKNMDNPCELAGVAILYDYSSKGSNIKQEEDISIEDYLEFMKESEYSVFLKHDSVMIEKAKYSFDGKKAYFTVRLQNGPRPYDAVRANFVLVAEEMETDEIIFQSAKLEEKRQENMCWFIESMLIRPESMRRRRRR